MTIRLFDLWTVVNNASMNMMMQVSIPDADAISYIEYLIVF